MTAARPAASRAGGLKGAADRSWVLALVGLTAGLVGLAQGCNSPSCEEVHDPTCWIPPAAPVDAASDGEDGDTAPPEEAASGETEPDDAEDAP